METHQFHVTSIWTGNSDGDGALTVPCGDFEYGVPPALGGKPGRCNPEEMLISAVVTCYCITYQIIAERKRIDVPKLEVAAEGEVVTQPDKTLKFTHIRLKPRITLSNAAHTDSAIDCAHKAEVYCLVSRALRGNVEITVEPEIVTAG